MDEIQAAAAAPPNAATKRREDKIRKKDPRSWENIVKSLTDLDEGAKLLVIEQKYNDLYTELRNININHQNLEKRFGILQKLHDHTQSEITKGTLARSRLENLCRELQKQNREIKEENMAKMKEEEERRKELSVKFASKLNEISSKMMENKGKSDELHDENQKMTEKLSELYNQFQIREDEISKMASQIELERKFSEVKLAQANAEKEMYSKKHDLMQVSLEKSEANCHTLLETIKGLQENINMYKGQYDEFENAMSKSNKAFDRFKYEMTMKARQLAKLEKESQSWKAKWQDSTTSVIELTELNRNLETVIQGNERRVEQLQKLCRQLQVDRAAYLKLLKTNGIEPSTQNVEEKAEGAIKKTPIIPLPTVTKKEKELKLLKSSLKAAQEELSRAMFEEARSDRDQPSKPKDGLVLDNSNTATNQEETPKTVNSTLPASRPRRPIVVKPRKAADGESVAMINGELFKLDPALGLVKIDHNSPNDGDVPDGEEEDN